MEFRTSAMVVYDTPMLNESPGRVEFVGKP